MIKDLSFGLNGERRRLTGRKTQPGDNPSDMALAVSSCGENHGNELMSTTKSEAADLIFLVKMSPTKHC